MGYINPDHEEVECAECHGDGYTADARRISETFYNFDDRSQRWSDKITQDEVQALVDEGRLQDFTHTWTRETGWVRREDGYVPTAEEVNGAQRSHQLGIVHDAINRYILIDARCKRLGIKSKCPVCEGNGYLPNPNEAERVRAESWKKYEPPAGDGWQLWETTSEGSPISPVFQTAEALADWCADNASIFAREKLPRETWLSMFQNEHPDDAVDLGSMVVGSPGHGIGSIAGNGVKVTE
jgi:hypothetical protein